MQTCRVLTAIMLIGVMAFAGSAQAAVILWGPVADEATNTVDSIVILWLDDYPEDYITDIVQEGGPGHPDVYYYSDLTPLLDRHYTEGSIDIPITIVMDCSGIERDIDGVEGNPYYNTYNSIGVSNTIDYVHGVQSMPPMGELELCAEGGTFSEPLSAGWNLISLPLTPSDNSTSAVLSGALHDAVYRYNAESKQFESVLDATMDPGIGYFVHATTDCTWEYSGTTAYTTMDVPLEAGLNMVGWLNCSKDVDGAISSVEGDYFYVARWNTSAQKFDVYNPAAPPAFNDCLTTMDPGTGYFISAKRGRTLSKSC